MIGLYSVGARLGVVPSDPTVAVRWITGNAAPIINEAEKEIATATGVNLPPVPPGIGSALSNLGTATYPTSTYTPPAYGAPNYGPQNYGQPPYGAGDIACHFSPRGGCTDAVVNEIRQARQQILVQAYSFTSQPIAAALVEAHSRGVSVVIILDKSQKSEQYSGADYVAHAGIPTLIDSAHAIAHNKIMLIDGQTIITGSFNFTKNAEESNAENLLVLRGRPDLYQSYENNFRHHYSHSQAYQGRGLSGPTTRGFSSPQPAPAYSPVSSSGIIAYPR
ncbi:MAG: phospholipase D family protein [Planctomycetia bacterium]|nr:phospholipase D family protein [Planctomycetia bacterium]